MLVKLQSVLTKQWHTMEVPLTQEQFDAWQREGVSAIRDAYPKLTKQQIHFLTTGTTLAEWEILTRKESESC
jgi:hypothetical protein